MADDIIFWSPKQNLSYNYFELNETDNLFIDSPSGAILNNCNISKSKINSAGLELLFNYSYFVETIFNIQYDPFTILAIDNSYFINCYIESLSVDFICHSYYKNSTIINITGYIENVFTDKSTSVNNCTFIQEIPYPDVEPILCQSIPLEKNYTNHEKNSSIKYTFIDEKIEITYCKFINVSITNDEGAAINIIHPAYQYFVASPFIKIDNIFFWKCQSELKPGAICIDYSNAHIEISHICGIEVSGFLFEFCYIDTNTYVSFNTSTTYSNQNLGKVMTYDIYDINGYYNKNNNEIYELTSVIRGINSSKCSTNACIFDLSNSTMKFCQEFSMITSFFVGFEFVTIDYYNYINSTIVNQTIFVFFSYKTNNVEFTHCVFIGTPLIEFYKDFVDTNNISFIDCNSTTLNNLESHFLPACRTPYYSSKNYKMIIYYSVSAALFVLIVAIVGVAYFWSRKKNSKVEERLELERELATDKGFVLRKKRTIRNFAKKTFS
ncbi:hypothetical protein TVAG_020950 [Trichomonas vaginalis G3]|uniref:Uncharacterized protein n=1 Tax=Trichomonas vaginalis (strain ATCC PRA-98 / G3) TaxID=412133 RepID=A2DH77_TRIV3|nr:hypothetical protein TVAGG3_0677140 [Trichomonas vaginalis G3]EAY20150.1 hypothetical protein TVAG_020950 [Trichomonas vaginalis G3]KAI5507617.1 hypothetical protein TVAGG3_0677140 [Trichomonas vaginalis G3]|eukprot:XP_001581136.1 hypothetical protein [Trichomonas vaginalis G3]